MRRIVWLWVFTLHASLLCASNYTVSLKLSTLAGHPAGPFAVAFQLTDASGTGDANNTVTISGLNFGGGSPTGTPTLLGGATGSLSSTVTLTDSSFLGYFIQRFAPGTQLSFQVTTTSNVDATGADLFSFSLLDSSGQELPTVAGDTFFDPFLTISVDSQTATVQSFAGDPTKAPAAGGPPIPAPTPVLTGVPVSIKQNGVVPVYSTVPVVQPGSWISIYGTNLANGTAVWKGDFPSSLGGTSVTINGKPAYLWFVSPSQINLQAPDDPTIGNVGVIVANVFGAASSNVTLAAYGPSLSLLADERHAAAVIPTADGSGVYGGGAYDIDGPQGVSLGLQTRPVKAGEVLMLYGVGFGSTNPVVLAGKVFSGAAATTGSMQLTIGGVPVTPTFSGLVAAGLYQINLVIPSGLKSGDQPVSVTIGGQQTPSGIYVAVQ